ncbi:trimeric intracellular cation channel family protein [Aliiroseovarius sp. PTFE2010]|uniref:trimeric intracellular cation channel family protein n=1 Tax=Aliiroseovarius sp. PTFE2010 TaxID=3417190 RepID=UPI003CF40B81
MTFLTGLDYASVAVFAASGALAASRQQLDLVGFFFLASLTAVGGGTIRDLLLDREVFWLANPSIIGVAVCVALLVFFTAHLLESRLRALTWLDALALSVAVAAGSGAALSAGQPAVVVVLMGVVTGVMGGLMRDVVCNEVPLVLKQGELYASAAFAGACATVPAVYAGLSSVMTLLACTALTFALRAGSIAFGWRLPVYKSRPPRA